MRILIFIVITVVEMDLCMLSSIGRRKLMLVVLNRIPVVLVMYDLRGVLLDQRHKSCSCYFMALLPLRCQELLVL
jgi:hypothetical protein